MNIVDIIIVLFCISGIIVGLKRGLLSELISFFGFFGIIILSFYLKNPVSVFLYEHLPFFKFAGVIKGVTVLNIALYELIAFLAIFTILTVILIIVLKITNILDKVVNATIILAPISKLGGAAIGFIESYVWIYIILYILSMPIFNIEIINESKYKDTILNNTPIISNIAGDSLNVIYEFASLKEKYEVEENAEQFNKETLDLFLKYNVITVDSVQVLVDKNKLQITNIDEVLNKYKES